ncbi:hypothetical protein [Chryseolinea soli]|uniref:Phosphate ABC transporter substrate-binding protein n=1 Tax=Chryseolinea soli TaxID=2321403 RepID=A0A385SM34_9BACT|nr:hypothetical protein [Chryseolinea soli]AYB32034.1 hypothetical protein D4L85_16310 [Chryseolinea soli]
MKKISTLFVFLLISVLLTSFNRETAAGESITIIVNKENPVANLAPGEVKLYYLRKIKKRWPGINKNIRPAGRKSKCAEQDAFYAQVLGMTADEVEQYFAARQLQNAERPYDKFLSDGDIIRFVEEEPGAIAYVNARSLTEEAKKKVKVVLIW